MYGLRNRTGNKAGNGSAPVLMSAKSHFGGEMINARGKEIPDKNYTKLGSANNGCKKSTRILQNNIPREKKT